MFPAYSKTRRIASPELSEPDDEEADFSGRYSSFASRRRKSKKEDEEKQRKRQLEKERKEQEAKRRRKVDQLERLVSHHSIKLVNILSDDDSDIEVPMEVVPVEKESKNRKKKHGESKKKKRKRKSRSSSSSASSKSSDESTSSSSASDVDRTRKKPIAQLLTTPRKWSFMTKLDLKDASSYFIMDSNGDKSNFYYDSLYQGETSKYKWVIRQILGDNHNLQKSLFGEPEDKTQIRRYFDDKVRKSWNQNPERLWRKKTRLPMTDYMELSNYALTESDLMDESGNIKAEKCEAVDGGFSLIEANAERKSQQYNTQLSNDKHNIELWLKFLAIQDEVFLVNDDQENAKKGRAERLTSRALLDRKITILDKAIALNFDSVELRLERLKIGIHLWEEEQWNREVTNVEFKFRNSSKMWKGILDLLENDTRHFKLSSQLKKMQTCLKKLSEVLSGNLFTHPPMPDTERFVSSVIRRYIQLLRKCDYTEKAIATAQAVCEFNLCTPQSLENATVEEKRKIFEIFWDSGIARIGDENAKGWANSMDDIKSGTIVTDLAKFNEDQAEYEKLEQEIYRQSFSNQFKSPYRTVWQKIENLRSQRHWRPVRDMEAKCDDPDRFVAMQDVADVLQQLSRPVANDLLFDILEDFGAVIHGRDPLMPSRIMQKFSIFPDLDQHWKDFGKFVCRFIDLACSYAKETRDLLLSSNLKTCAYFLMQDAALNNKSRLKKFREEAKNLSSKDKNFTNLSLMATYAEEILELGDAGQARNCAEKFLTLDLWDEKSRPRLVSLLRLALVYVQACDDVDKRAHLANIAFNGKPGNELDFDAQLVQNRYNLRLTVLKKEANETTDWEGSALDLTSTLALLFAYYYTEEEKRMQAMRKLFHAMAKILNCDKMHFFMNNYIDLMNKLALLRPFESPNFVRTVVGAAVNNFPTNIKFLKMYIDANAVGTRIIHLRRFLEENLEDENVNICRSYGVVYLELLRHRMLLETSEKQSPELHRLRTILRKSSERIAHRDDTFWRLLLRIENERNDDHHAREVFYVAYSECPWSKSLIMDFKNVNAGEHEKLLDAIVEKELRLRCHLEEIAIGMQTTG